MMQKIYSACSDGTVTTVVDVESSTVRGFAGINVIGHSSELCRQGVERAKAALEMANINFPQKRIIINLSPADLKKTGSQLDLAFAVSLYLLVAVPVKTLTAKAWMFVAELSLDGSLKPVKNIVSYALAARAAGIAGLVLAPQNCPEVAALCTLAKDKNGPPLLLQPFESLAEVIAWLEDGTPPGNEQEHSRTLDHSPQLSFDDMVLDPYLRKAAMAVAVGQHSLLLCGVPGCGKSMLSERLPSIFPPMPPEMHLDALQIHSAVAASVPASLLSGFAPFRAPHHQSTAAAVIGIPEAPGELSLAHGGLLFLDEFPEFRRDIIEALRDPLETGVVRVSRAKTKTFWKAHTTLAIACNLCPCGWLGSKKRRCRCTVQNIANYRRKLSGPILDRIDMHINMPEAPENKADAFVTAAQGEIKGSQTKAMRQRVLAARAFGKARNSKLGVDLNRELQTKHMLSASGLGEEQFRKLLAQHIPASASYRSALRCLRVARSLADLRESEAVSTEDLEQAWQWQAEAAAQARGDGGWGLC